MEFEVFFGSFVGVKIGAGAFTVEPGPENDREFNEYVNESDTSDD